MRLGGPKPFPRPIRALGAFFTPKDFPTFQYEMESASSPNSDEIAPKKRGEFSIESLLLSKGNSNLQLNLGETGDHFKASPNISLNFDFFKRFCSNFHKIVHFLFDEKHPQFCL